MSNKQDLSRTTLVRAVASKVAANIMLVLFLPDSLSSEGLGKNCGSDNPLEGSSCFYVLGKPCRFDLTQQFPRLEICQKIYTTEDFRVKKFTQKTRNFRHLLNRDKKCVNALNWDKTSKKCSVTM